jgi:hypothetical protein
MSTATQEKPYLAGLRKAPVGSLKAYYRTARQIELDPERADEHESATEVRRWITAELLERLPREEVVEFEAEVKQAEDGQVTIQVGNVKVGDRYFARSAAGGRGRPVTDVQDGPDGTVILSFESGPQERLGWRVTVSVEAEVIANMSEAEAREHYAIAAAACRNGLDATETKQRLYAQIQTLAQARKDERADELAGRRTGRNDQPGFGAPDRMSMHDAEGQGRR